MVDENAERTEQPTRRRRQRARQEGYLAISHDLNRAVRMMGAAVVLAVSGSGILLTLGELLKTSITSAARGTGGGEQNREIVPETWVREVIGQVGIPILAPLGIMLALLVVSQFLQTRAYFSLSRVKPQLKRIMPHGGLRRLFSLHQWWVPIGGMGRILLVAAVAAVAANGILPGAIATIESEQVAEASDSRRASQFLGATLLDACLILGSVMLTIGITDLAIRRWKFEKSLRMTREEVRQELRESEVDPRITRRRRLFRSGS